MKGPPSFLWGDGDGGRGTGTVKGVWVGGEGAGLNLVRKLCLTIRTDVCTMLAWIRWWV
jgi:hypothetical protein